MLRRNFLTLSLLSGGAVFFAPKLLFSKELTASSKSKQLFQDIAAKFPKSALDKMTIGQLTAEVGKCFLGTPYVGGTLDREIKENVVVDLTGLDCVTFWENSLNIARILKTDKKSFNDLLNAVQYTRYRYGELTDYTSRLHYTSEWIIDNIRKGVIEDITSQLGGYKAVPKPDFMSKNSDFYKQLKNNDELVKKIADIEKVISKNNLNYIEKSKISKIEDKIKSGDMIAIVTRKQGLDYAHVGIAIVINGECRLMHASLKQKKVVIDTTISKYLAGVDSHLGISVCRPVDYVGQIIDFQE